METKTLKIEIPDGYEIDKEKSTFENIVFKKVDEVVIKWNKNYCGVEIKADGEHFLLDGNPDYCVTWNDAMRFYDTLQFWKLPTVKQLRVICKYLDKINNVIEENGGFILSKGFYWSIEEDNTVCAWYVYMNDGCACNLNKGFDRYVRAVSAL